MSTRTVYSPIVGNNFRLSGRLVLPTLGVDHPLILDPEPENKYDPDAIKVCVEMYETERELGSELVPVIIHLGYIPKSGNKTDTTGTGNKQVMRIISQPFWEAVLAFAPTGAPLVRITYKDEDI